VVDALVEFTGDSTCKNAYLAFPPGGGPARYVPWD
jgi:hypothetical protein